MDDLARQRLNRESAAFRKRLADKAGWLEASMPSMYYDRAGKPIGLGDWAYLHADEGYVRVASTHLRDSWVSTVWLGHDMSFGLGPPVIFETMIFGGPLDQYQTRHYDEADALVGHLVACAHVRSVPFWRTLWWIVVDSVRSASEDYARHYLWRAYFS